MVVQACILTIIVWSSHITRNDIRGTRIRGFQINVAATAMFVGARDDLQFAKAAITNPGAVSAEAQFMRENGLSAYSDGAYTQIGKPLESVYRLASSEKCTGVVESTAPVAGSGQSQALRVAGWVWDREHHTPSICNCDHRGWDHRRPRCRWRVASHDPGGQPPDQGWLYRLCGVCKSGSTQHAD